MPISTNIFITLIIQNDEINCTGGHTRPITVFSFIAPFQSDVAERWKSKSFDIYCSATLLCHMTLKQCRWSFPIFLYVVIFYIHSSVALFKFNPAINLLFKFNNRNTRTRCVIRAKLTITIPERRHLHRFGIFIVNFWTRCSSVSYVYWEKSLNL